MMPSNCHQGEVDEILVILEDSMQMISTIMSSRFVGGIRLDPKQCWPFVHRHTISEAKRICFLIFGIDNVGDSAKHIKMWLCRADVEKVERNLRLFGDTLDAWLECQGQWLYLETIFGASDIQRQLPAEAKAFAQVWVWTSINYNLHIVCICHDCCGCFRFYIVWV
jgi:hypothetical protein